MPRRQYSPEERTEALELYRTAGPTAVADQLGIPKQTVMGWAIKAGVGTVRNENAAVRIEAARITWEERRLTLAHELGHLAQVAMRRALEEAEAGKPRDAQSLATTMAIAVDKAQLLTGEANMRVEHRHVDALDAELQSLTAQLEVVDGG